MTSNGMMKDVVKVRKEKMRKLLSCPLCHNLFNEATTISECLHTFCRKCIYEKLDGENLDCCPVCNAHLGCIPLEKLRPDNNLQDLRAKIFPFETAKCESPNAISSAPSESSNPISSAPSPPDPPQQSLSSLEKSSEDSEKKPQEENSGQLKRSTRLIEKKTLAEKNKASASTLEEDFELVSLNQLRTNKGRGKGKRRGKGSSKVQQKGPDGSRSELDKQETTQQAQEENATSRFNPIWFSLIASNNQEGIEALPQFSPSYLRVKDGNMSVSIVKKYIAQKLSLVSKDQVELTLRGQPLVSTLFLHNLIDMWTQTEPNSEMITTSVGSSGKDFVMVLHYGRKALSSD